MNNREDIYNVIKKMMFELFEIEENELSLETRLYEDLDFDSIDAIDMIVQLEKKAGKPIKPDDFKNVKTINDIVEVVYQITQSK